LTLNADYFLEQRRQDAKNRTPTVRYYFGTAYRPFRQSGHRGRNQVCSGAMRAVLQQLAPALEKSSGDKLVIEYATAGKVEEEVAADAAIDVAILTKPRAEKLVRAVKMVGGTTTVLARVPIGVA
jgi:hypothetical protein